jgi:hypothetical protein
MPKSWTVVGAVALLPLSGFCSDGNGLSGDWVCGCHRADESIFDASASIKVLDSSSVECRDGFGEVSKGRFITERSVSCFNSVGRLSSDGKTIYWENGSVWDRVHIFVIEFVIEEF